ncbi:non-functional pseudokinase ZED1-like [Pistacia vera]|uniref:non-functional pseudokinase ZED1-like n=1 Tax=Pistacia vera TaxID=55513 RepID=UPI001263D750|nr:non-functional pseudokinase ZED1-like [Pistacia vera]
MILEYFINHTRMSSYLKESKRQKKKTFLRNGKILLEKLIASCNGKYNPILSFTDKKIKMATNNYDQQNNIILTLDFSLYKGFLQDRLVSVAKFSPNVHITNEGFSAEQLKRATNNYNKEKVIEFDSFKILYKGFLRNRPVFVMQFLTLLIQETFADRIYRSCEPHFKPLLLTHRLKIAMKIANAIAYLYSGFPQPIIFRSINPLTIVFTEQYVAKLFDFSYSMSIPEGETHVEEMTTYIIGPSGSFVRTILVHRDSMKRRRMIDTLEVESSLEDHVKNCIEQSRFTEMLLLAFTELALSCLSLSEEDRPTMIDVAKQLRQMYIFACQLMPKLCS